LPESPIEQPPCPTLFFLIAEIDHLSIIHAIDATSVTTRK